MIRQKKDDFLTALEKLQRILNNKPRVEKMWQEVKMMGFQIKPIFGNISLLSAKKNELVESLWKIGKLDEFFNQEFKKLSPREKEIFFEMINEAKESLESKLGRFSLDQKINLSNLPPLIEMEVFRKKIPHKKLN
ncbi:MAG: hypothetical protein N2482_00680 [Patescibacteria group bacterium]|nr:hypothetical protein [Patescibacteria group bacterium]